MRVYRIWHYYAQVIVGHAYSHHLQYLNLQLVVYKESKTRSEISIDITSDSTQFECIKVRDLSFTISHKSNERCLTRTDSDLEAFSRDPTDSSFAVFTVQWAAFTKYLNEVFLSY